MTNSTRGLTFKPATIDDTYELTSQMLDKGLQDHERLGEQPILSVAKNLYELDCYYGYGPDGNLYGAYGVAEDNFLWLQLTKQVKQSPLTTVRFGKVLMEHINRPFLWSIIDLKNTALLNLARYLGFKVLRIYPDGPDNTYSLEIVRLCPSHLE